MTVADNTSRNQYTATSGQTVFAYTFEIVDKDHIVVLQNGTALSEGTDYTVSNVGNDNGGNITLTSGATADDIMTLYRDMPYSRDQNYTNSGDFLASEVNNDFDNLWLAGEQTERSFSQSIRKPITDADSISMELPEASSRSDTLMGFNTDGSVTVSQSDLLNVTASAAEINILDGATLTTEELNVLDGITATTDELNILDGVTADATELNILDGATLTTTELNYVDGVTSPIQAQLDGKQDIGGGEEGLLLAALKARTGFSNGSIAFVSGRTDINDGYQGLFTFDASDLSTDDLFTADTQNAVFVPPNTDTTGASGAWVRQWDSQELLIQWFGAIGDTAMDGSVGTDDTVALQAAATFLFALPLNTDAGGSGSPASIVLRKGHAILKFEPRRVYTTTDVIDFGGSIDDPVGQGGIRVSIEFNNAVIAPKANGSGRIPDGVRMWGQACEWSQLAIRYDIHNTQHEVYGEYLARDAAGDPLGPAGVVMGPTEDNTPSTVLNNYSIYRQVDVHNAFYGFALYRNTDYSFKNKWDNCNVVSCFNYAWLLDSDPADGISTTNVFEQTWANAGGTGSTVVHNSAVYECIQTHVPSSATEPGVGTDWETKWYLNPVGSSNNVPAWSVSETRYYEDGKGYYFFDCSNTTFQGGCAMDGGNNEESGNVIFANTSAITIIGGFHLETYRSTHPDNFPIDMNSGDLIIDLLYLPGCYWANSTSNIMIGSSNAVIGRRCYIEAMFDKTAKVSNTLYAVDASKFRFVKTGHGVSAAQVKGEAQDYQLEERFIDTRTLTVNNASEDVTITGDNPGLELQDANDDTNLRLAVNAGLAAVTASGATAGSDSTFLIKSNNGTSDVQFFAYDGSNDFIRFNTRANGESFKILSNGNVGIDSSLPSSLLSIGTKDPLSGAFADDGNIFVKTTTNNDTAIVMQENTGTEQWGMGVNVDGDLVFSNSGSNGPDVVFPDGGGITVADSTNPYTLPAADGSSGQILKTDGSGNVTFGSASGVFSVVDDTSPQLGGDLQSNGNDINFADNDKAVFGAGSDLQIYHDGSNSYVKDAGTGDLFLQGSNNVQIESATGANMIYATAGAQVRLFYNGSPKFNTTSTGVDVTGNIKAGSGAASDIRITSTATTGIIEGNSSGSLTFRSNGASSDVVIQAGGSAPTDEVARFTHDGRVGLGTSLPSTTLDVAGTVTADSATVVTSGGKSTVAIGDQATGTYGQLLLHGGNGKYNFSLGTQYNVNNAFEITPSTAAGGTTFSTPALVVDSSGRVGIGTASPDEDLHVHASSGDGIIKITGDGSETNGGKINGFNGGLAIQTTDGAGNYPERMRIDSSGNLLVGKTGLDVTDVGHELRSSGYSASTRDGSTVGSYTRLNSNGTILEFRKDSAAVGSIGTNTTNNFRITSNQSGHSGIEFGTAQILATIEGTGSNGGVDLGASNQRWKDLHLSGTAYSAALNVDGGSSGIINFGDVTSNYGRLYADSTGTYVGSVTANPLIFRTTNTERMRIDSAGNVLFGATGTATTSYGAKVLKDNSASEIFAVHRQASDGSLIEFARGGTAVGSIGAKVGNAYYAGTATGITFGSANLYPTNNTGTKTDAALDLGSSSQRFKDLYLSGNSYVGASGTALRTASTATTGIVESNSSGSLTLRANSGSAHVVIQAGGSSATDEVARFTSSGHVLVGKTANDNTTEGAVIRESGEGSFTTTSNRAAIFNRRTTDGEIVGFRKDGSTVGSVVTEGGNSLIIQGGTTSGSGFHFHHSSGAITPARNGARIDNAIDLGSSSHRFDDIYATNGTIQTSDRNEKQDIEELSDAEQRVAVAAKALLRKFRWKDAVEEKGDDARIHFGIIAQDLQDAFTAEGLDAGRYAMFINTTWTDEETGEERSRMGVRYSELLAFIISAI